MSSWVNSETFNLQVAQLEAERVQWKAVALELGEALKASELALNTCVNHRYSDGMVHHQTFNARLVANAVIGNKPALATLDKLTK